MPEQITLKVQFVTNITKTFNTALQLAYFGMSNSAKQYCTKTCSLSFGRQNQTGR